MSSLNFNPDAVTVKNLVELVQFLPMQNASEIFLKNLCGILHNLSYVSENHKQLIVVLENDIQKLMSNSTVLIPNLPKPGNEIQCGKQGVSKSKSIFIKIRELDKQIKVLTEKKEEHYKFFDEDKLFTKTSGYGLLSNTSDNSEVLPLSHFDHDVIMMATKQSLSLKPIKQETVENTNSVHLTLSSNQKRKAHVFEDSSGVKGEIQLIETFPVHEEVTCMVIHHNYIYYGSITGTVSKISLDVIQYLSKKIHKDAVTCMLLWDEQIISSSYDSTIFILTLNFEVVRHVCLQKPIRCFTQWKGNLYIGTRDGYLLDISVKTLLKTKNFKKMNCGFLKLEVVSINSLDLLVTLNVDNTVSVRNLVTGSVFMEVQLPCFTLVNIFSIESTDTCLFLCTNEIKSFSLKDTFGNVRSVYPEGGLYALPIQDKILVIKANKNLLLFDSNMICIAEASGHDIKGRVTAASTYKNYVVLSTSKTVYIYKLVDKLS